LELYEKLFGRERIYGKKYLRSPDDHHVIDGDFFINDLKNKINMKTVFLITSYCDTDLKIEVLNECIDNLKSISGYDICLHAHYPLNDNIQKRVNYYLYDSSNPILYYPEKYITWWIKYKQYTLHIYTEDYGYAVLQQWKRGFDFLKNIYDNIIILNYDTIITEKLLNEIENKSDFEGCAFLHENDNVIMPLASIKSSSELFNKISKEKYKEINGFAEDFAKYIYILNLILIFLNLMNIKTIFIQL
jgi:hypothetical protein